MERIVKRLLRAILAAMPNRMQRMSLAFYRGRLVFAYDWLRRVRGVGAYRRWVRKYDRIEPSDRTAILADIASFSRRPLISMVASVSNPSEPPLRSLLESILAQLYPDWELCIGAGAAAPTLREMLTDYAARDPRIKLSDAAFGPEVSAIGNAALSLVSGEFVAVVAADALLPCQALYLIAREILEHPDADVIYGDTDRLDARGRRCCPDFKSDWNPDLFLTQDMITGLGAFRTSLVRAVGGFRAGIDGAEAYDLALRVTEQTQAERIRHIPHVLYHQRGPEDDPSPAARAAAQSAVMGHLWRRGFAAVVDATPSRPYRQVRFVLDKEPRLTVIIPTRDRHDLLARCIRGVLSGTDYENVEVLVVDNLSSDAATLRYLEQIGANPRVRVLRYRKPFNFSLINNWAAGQTRGDVLLFLNNDTEIIHRDWARELVANALRPEVGAVGAKLLYPNGRVQHGGIILGIGGVGGHFHLRRRAGDPGYCARAVSQQNLSAVTAACLAMRRENFEQIGGFDGENLPIAFNDVDLCLRLRERGYLIVWTPSARLYHHETASRASDLVGSRHREFAEEQAYMRARWGSLLDNDPYFNPNLSLQDIAISLAFPPRRAYPWRSAGATVGVARCRS